MHPCIYSRTQAFLSLALAKFLYKIWENWLISFQKLSHVYIEDQTAIEADRQPQIRLRKNGGTGVEKNTAANTCND